MPQSDSSSANDTLTRTTVEFDGDVMLFSESTAGEQVTQKHFLNNSELFGGIFYLFL